MIRADNTCAGACRSSVTGFFMVPYERAMALVRDNAEERAAPRVPDESEKAADVFRPKFGPDI